MEQPEETLHSTADAQPDAITSLGQGGGGGEEGGEQMNSSGKIRKRTKTGCLTCRKRRIKCDEGRPICNNCLKSKRHCEGYNVKYAWKTDSVGAHPVGASPWGPYGAHNVGDPMQMIAPNIGSGPNGRLQTIAPRPNSSNYQAAQPDGLGYATALPQQFSEYDLPPTSLDPRMVTAITASNEQIQDQGFQGPGSAYPPDVALQLSLPVGPTEQEPFPGSSTDSSGPSHTLTNHAESRHQPPAVPVSDEDDSGNESSNGEGWPLQVVQSHVQAPNRYQMINRARFYTDYVQSTALGEYMRSPHATELRDDAKRHLFEHFMRITGPTMSLYERHPFDPQERQWTSPETGNSIWEFTFPLMSFQHPCLLHAILAMASLQIAKLEGCPPTAAHRHYHLALRRVAKNVTLDHKRRQPATLAAILLLAYFEVWSSEHTKWTSHLYGARMIFTEIPLLAMARRCLPLKRQQHLQQRRMMNWLDTDMEADFDLNYDLLSTITGAKIAASHYNLDPELVVLDKGAPPTARDIESFETLTDLYWWYCKMDVYQCMLSGTKLFMPYRLWTQCPPRAPASSMASIYGTYDHLILLLGRLADFASRDMARKRAASRARNTPPTGSPSPPFSGMLPTQGPFRAPRGFDSPQSDPRKDAHDVDDAHASYNTAVQEWQGICHAFGTFEKHLGKDFRPLSAEFADNRPTPFGPSRQYRTYSVAGIWMNYNMGMIHLYRSHPDMPPTALQSVGLAAKQTGYHAQEIGRIAAGLSGESSAMDKLHNALAAAYIESAFCLFYAAVQYQDAQQRRWVVNRMHEITRLTGWQSARHIAGGCESGWIKAAELGRGPPYTRLAQEDQPPESVWMSARRIDRRIQELRDSSLAEGTGDGKIVLPMTERAHYAVGLLGIESDFNHLELTDDVFHGSR